MAAFSIDQTDVHHQKHRTNKGVGLHRTEQCHITYDTNAYFIRVSRFSSMNKHLCIPHTMVQNMKKLISRLYCIEDACLSLHASTCPQLPNPLFPCTRLSKIHLFRGHAGVAVCKRSLRTHPTYPPQSNL
ncbi:unnamed protein product [Ectocarpus fasciculatus]